MKTLLPQSLKRNAAVLGQMKTVWHLSQLVKLEEHKLSLISIQPPYKVYEIPKKDGSRRLIEDPQPPLKKVLRTLNHYLQAHYYFRRPACVHGFCISARHEDDRNIMSNAAQHLSNSYMLNIDLEDFFHTISDRKVGRIIQHHFPNYDNELTETIIRLTTYHGRLPMGSPASPVLSNYDCLELDSELMSIARYGGLTYSRFADDLSFSSNQPITSNDEEMIREVIQSRGYLVNEEKVKRFGKNDEKIVTGLRLVEKEIRLPNNYLPQLQEEINRLKQYLIIEQRYQTGITGARSNC